MIEYFESRARTYRKKSARGLWRIFRKVESRAVFQMLSPRKGERLLDLGSGAGYYSIPLKRFGMKVLALDSSPGMLRELEAQGVETWLGRAEDAPEFQRFDSILAAGLLEFVEEPDAVIKKCARILEPGGKLVLLIPSAGISGIVYKASHEFQGCPVFIRKREDYIQLAEEQGFEFTASKRCTPISTVLAFRRGIKPVK